MVKVDREEKIITVDGPRRYEGTGQTGQRVGDIRWRDP